MAEEKKDKEKEKKIGPKAKAALTKDEPKKSEHKSEGKKHHRMTHLESHGKGRGFTVRHSPGEKDEVSYAAPDLNSVNAGLQQNLGETAEPEAPPAQPSGPMPTPGAGV